MLANGSSPRRRHRPITQHAIAQDSLARLGRPLEILDDQGCTTADDHWRLYKEKWLLLEEEYGPAWRNDKQVLGRHKMNSRATWWSTRKPIYTLITYYIDMEKLSEAEALIKVNETFSSVGLSRGIRPIKAVTRACRDKLAQLGVHAPKGRPKGRGKHRTNDGSAFASAFAAISPATH
jgi:hypothetical protein